MTAGDILVRTADPSVERIAITIYVLGWLGVVGAGARIWLTGFTWTSVRWFVKLGRTLSAAAAVVLAIFCVVWKVAGTSLLF